tara:strand:+ start:314 stop:919 length:606 start_codon:yes stop_codon:yes gene_type:complete
LKKKILILGPQVRNIRIIKNLKKKYSVVLSNKKISKNFLIRKNISIIITSGYPYLVKNNLIKFVDIAINLHNSYLPYGRGIYPNVWCFVESYPSGITIHELDKKFDTGAIILQKKIYFNNIKKHTLKTTHDILIKELEKFFLKNYEKIFNSMFKKYSQSKYNKCTRYHNRKESENLMKNFKLRWNTKILEVKKFKKNMLIK